MRLKYNEILIKIQNFHATKYIQNSYPNKSNTMTCVCGHVTPYGVEGLGQHYFRERFIAETLAVLMPSYYQ